MSARETPFVYNLFPRLVGPTTRWAEHAARAREMGFGWLFLNPWHYPGFSGSLYAVKEWNRLNPAFVPPGEEGRGVEPLREALAAVSALGVRPMMDLVINHAAKDSPLVQEHPEWFRWEAGQVASPFVRDPDDPSKVTVWGDLAEVNNEPAEGRVELWRYWSDRVREAQELGFRSFRCDAAYKVPARLWRFVIDQARAVDPEVVFFAETLGAPVEDVAALADAGFDFFFNSSKWWNLSEPWALAQHEAFRRIAPSVAFPESHDTTRLAADTGGDEAVQRQRYAVAAAFSAGVMIPVGYEFGFRKALHVIDTRPTDWERRAMDLRPFITRVNRLKAAHPVLRGEGVLRAPLGLHGDVLVLERRENDSPRAGRGWIVANKVWAEGREVPVASFLGGSGAEDLRLFRVCRDGAPAEGEPVPETLALERAEVVYLLPAATSSSGSAPAAASSAPSTGAGGSSAPTPTSAPGSDAVSGPAASAEAGDGGSGGGADA